MQESINCDVRARRSKVKVQVLLKDEGKSSHQPREPQSDRKRTKRRQQESSTVQLLKDSPRPIKQGRTQPSRKKQGAPKPTGQVHVIPTQSQVEAALKEIMFCRACTKKFDSKAELVYLSNVYNAVVVLTM